ncbi:amidohydrolase [Pseudoclavibacter sp. 13-3]|uniref:amidohydrolase n=1 Tax=Pseudoclavibacter sp. 13-3 TaxID=2901228 RepID=UPI001E2D4D88|nr:amidohydrolase [Pseudoclavibacter sp. 13-3]MCD7101254.1 amidohydrolase [Pseudoclavibacter sp. 13-3]
MQTDRTFTIVDANLYLGQGRWSRGCVGVSDGLITSVSADASDVSGTPQEGRVIDARGGSLLPGLQDAHVHPEHGGSGLLGVDLAPVHDVTDYQRLLQEYAEQHPQDEVVVGYGWYGDLFPGGMPGAAVLDEAINDRPVIVNGHDGHSMWCNSRALQEAGITEATPDPRGGRIVRDASGRPTGTLLDAAMDLAAALRPAKSIDGVKAALLAAQHRLNSVGVTAWADAMVGVSELGPDPFEAYLQLAREGALHSHVSLALWWDRTRGLEQIDDFVRRREQARDEPLLSASTVKIMQDGMVENHTAAMLAPYADSTEPISGDSFIPAAELREISQRLDRLGFDIHYHACGDRAVRECLDAVEAVRRSGGGAGRRHQIAHLDVVHPADLQRFAELDVTANVQMLWARRDKEMIERKLPQLGVAREAMQFPFASLRRAGARLAAGSDWPVSDPNPLWAVHTGMLRTAPTADVHAIGGQALTHPLERQEGIEFSAALDAYLTGAAWVNRLDDRGALRPGLAADLVLLRQNLRETPDLSTVEVIETFVDGVSVYQAE